MTSPWSPKDRMCSLERQVKDVVSDVGSMRNLVEKLMILEHQLQDTVKDVTSIKSTLGDLKTNMEDIVKHSALFDSRLQGLESHMTDCETSQLRLEEKHQPNASIPAEDILEGKLKKSEPSSNISTSPSTRSLGVSQSAANQVTLLRQDILDDNVYQISGSLYDGVIFVFLELHGMFPSILLLLLLILNVVVQVFYTILVYTTLSSSHFEDESRQAFRQWRLNVAHDVHRLDQLSGSSLASRVCDLDAHPALDFSTVQAKYVQQLVQYLEGGVGQLFAKVALLCWCTSICAETQQAIRLAAATLYVSISSITELHVHGDGQFSFRSMTRFRHILVGVIALQRFLLAGVLCWVGNKFLVMTPSVGEQLLNALALEFVLQLDELFFEAFAPLQTKLLVKKTHPLKLPAAFAGPTSPIFSILLVAGFVIPAILILLHPEYTAREAAIKELCPYIASGKSKGMWSSGFADDFESRDSAADEFIYTVQSHGIAAWAETQPFKLQASDSFHMGNVHTLIEGRLKDTRDEELFQRRFRSVAGVQRFVAASVEELITEFHSHLFLAGNGSQGCHDLNRTDGSTTSATGPGGSSYRHFVWSHISDALGYHVEDCAELLHFCNDPFEIGQLARNWCPVTCGCTDPGGLVMLQSPAHGCPGQCPLHKFYQAKVNGIPCLDTEPGDDRWESFLRLADDFEHHSLSLITSAIETYRILAAAMRNHGCGSVAQLGTWIWCDANHLGTLSWGASFRFWCPVSCKCRERVGALNCPNTCTNETQQVDFVKVRGAALRPKQEVGMLQMR